METTSVSTPAANCLVPLTKMVSLCMCLIMNQGEREYGTGLAWDPRLQLFTAKVMVRKERPP